MGPPPRHPRALPEELVEEILLRFPPDDPASLVRAALVCKPWCRLLSGRGFRRRFGQFHRTPPTLGFVCDLRDEVVEMFAHFVPTSSFCRPRAPCRRNRKWRTIDARHGRVLLYDTRWGWGLLNFAGKRFAIWDPIADELRELPILGPYKGLILNLFWRAVVLCAGDDTCNHLDCNRGAFQVVIVATDFNFIYAFVYSSEVGAWIKLNPWLHQPDGSSEVGTWSKLTPRLYHSDDFSNFVVPGALVENVLHFTFGRSAHILKYNLATQEISVIDAPVSFYGQRNVLTAMEGGHLGIAMAKDSNLHFWTRQAGPEGGDGWTQSIVIELEKLVPIGALTTSPCVVGADGNGVFFVLTGHVLYTVDVNTSQVKRVCNVSGCPSIFPYKSFYTPALGAHLNR